MASWLHGINILHISDTHIPDKRGNIHEGVNPCKKLDKLTEYIASNFNYSCPLKKF